MIIRILNFKSKNKLIIIKIIIFQFNFTNHSDDLKKRFKRTQKKTLY